MKRLLTNILILIVVVVGGAFAWNFAYDNYVKQAQEAEEKARSLNE
ncbi:MAG: hypothetical protein ACR2PZ_14050 [Pseudomonadales bacterium]